MFQIKTHIQFAINNLMTANQELQRIIDHERADMEDIGQAKDLLIDLCSEKKLIKEKIDQLESIENLIATAKGTI